MFASVAASVHGDIHEAQEAMGQGFLREYIPDMQSNAAYMELYDKYLKLGKFTESVFVSLSKWFGMSSGWASKGSLPIRFLQNKPEGCVGVMPLMPLWAVITNPFLCFLMEDPAFPLFVLSL